MGIEGSGAGRSVLGRVDKGPVRTMNQPKPHHRDFGFFVWMLPIFLFVFGFISHFSIGLPFLLAGIVLFGSLPLRGPVWPADLGLLAGLGAGLLLFWLLPTDL